MSQEDYSDLQRSIDEQGHSWRAGETSLSALPPEEQQFRLGLTLVPEEMDRIRAAISTRAPMAAEFPPAWDWRNVDGANWTTPIRDQKSCGSCVAFGTVGVLETMHKRHENDAALQTDLSEAHLFFCGCGDCCDKGWWPSYALDYAKSSGVPDEACFPYQDHNMPCADSCADWQDQALKVVDWQEVHGYRGAQGMAIHHRADGGLHSRLPRLFQLYRAVSTGTPAETWLATTPSARWATRKPRTAGSARTVGAPTGEMPAGSRSATENAGSTPSSPCTA